MARLRHQRHGNRDGFEPGRTVAQMVSVGWPDVISSLKTLMETGEPLPA